MNDRPTHEEREALIAGERAGTLEPGEAEELALLADLLANPSTWSEPRAGLEDAVVQAVSDAPARARAGRTSRRWRIAAGAVAAAAAIVVVLGIVVATTGPTGAQYEAALQGTPLAPGAHGAAGIVKEDAGYRVTLEASGLPRLRAGSFYQAWLRDPGGALVPLGTFSSSNGKVTLWSGVSPDRFTAFTVTIERADGNQASSGRRVLAGPVRPR
jgi:anti-sigma-K factor RskA